MSIQKISKIRKNYDKLSNQERLRLTANAIIRDDNGELGALISSTPKISYTMRDAWMVDRHEALWQISVVYWLATEEILREREEQSHRYSIMELNGSGVISLSDDNPQKDRNEQALLLLDLHIGEYDNLIWAISESIKKLANVVKLKPDELLAYVPDTVKQRLDWSRHDYDVDQDENIFQKVVKKYYELFANYWPDMDDVSSECA